MAEGPARRLAAMPGGAARPDERQSRYCEVTCAECGAVVLAAKFSVQHTSVQWDASGRAPVRRVRPAGGRGRADRR